MIDYFGITIAFIAIEYVLELFIDIRQYKCYSVKEVPKYSFFENIITPESFQKSQNYGAEKMQFGIIKGAFSLIVNLISLKLGFMPWLWETFGNNFGETLHSLIFMGTNSLFSYLISLPFDLYFTFKIEQKYGFNKQTLKLYFQDAVKMSILYILIGAPLLTAMINIINRTGPLFWFWLWCLIVIFNIILIIIYPLYIMPLFNKFTPIKESPVKFGVEKLANDFDFQHSQIAVMDGSKRSGHSNAFFIGLGKHRHIVLFDTLIDHLSPDEVVAVLAHELSHWKCKHTLKLMFVNFAHLLLCLSLFGKFINENSLYESFGFEKARIFTDDENKMYRYPCLIGFSLFMMVYNPVDSLFSFLSNSITRKFEYQADEGATKFGCDLVTPLVKLHKENLSTLIIDPIYSAYNFDHPTLLERVDAINKIMKEGNIKKRESCVDEYLKLHPDYKEEDEKKVENEEEIEKKEEVEEEEEESKKDI